MRRLISHSELSTAYDCQAKWDFAYGGRLAGTALKPHAPAARLRQGRAWGRGVAAFHQADPEQHSLVVRYGLGLLALNDSLDEDAAAMRVHGFYDQQEHHDMALRLGDILWDYVQGTEPLHISDPEFELMLPIPSRSGRGVSNRYAFHGFLDGIAVEDGRLWPVEYKLRDTLSDFEQVADMPQIRRYAWATERQLGIRVAGVIVDERLSIAPKPARWVKAKRKGEGVDGKVPSEAKDQLTTSSLYVEACLEAGVPINEETVRALDGRYWQKRHKVILRRSEIEEAGRELVSAAQYIAQLDSGQLHPVRNRTPWRCRGCAFKQACNDPSDRELLETNFELLPPKRDREPVEAATA